jgi:hypothetical protein
MLENTNVNSNTLENAISNVWMFNTLVITDVAKIDQ